MKGLTNDCDRGIKQYGSDIVMHNFDKAYFSGNIRDNRFAGFLCPPTSGLYRLIYEGEIHESYEIKYSTYTFNGITCNNRTSAYHYLFSGTCYNYKTIHSYDGDQTDSLYYQKESGDKIYITSETSYTCTRDICLKGSTDPRCIKSCTCKHKTRNNNIFFITFIHYLIAS